MSTGDRNNFGLGHAKITDSTPNNRALLIKYLRGLPSLDFSPKGCLNICQRFRIAPDELAAAVATLAVRPSQPTSALLRAIATAVGHHAIGGEEIC